MNSTYLFIKGLADTLAAAILLVLLSWLFLLVGLLYLLTGERSLFFRQERLGRNEKAFTLYKFRTLKANEHLPLDKRKFTLGSFLRYLSLDELPQLWNILKGEMSLVGPRPLPVTYQPLFSAEQRKRFTVKPGITGWAQVNGRHGIPWERKFELDNWYVDHQSFRVDLRIIFKTIVLLLSFKKDISLEEEPFQGSTDPSTLTPDPQ
ncbi:MAG: sugar transferase [Cyclobacteriaceae bacterium]|nr:sugar transferase [Cyclobacteriaceae bacterium]